MDRIRRAVDLRPFNAAFYSFVVLSVHAVAARIVLGLVGLGWALQLSFFRFVVVAALHTATTFAHARLLTVEPSAIPTEPRALANLGAFLAAAAASGSATLVLLGAGDDWLLPCGAPGHPRRVLGLLCGGRASHVAAAAGALLAALYAARVLRRREYLLRFQPVPRPRFFQVKAAYLSSLLDGPREGAAASLLLLLPLSLALLLRPPGLREAVGVVVAAAWCRTAWLAGYRVAQAICGQAIPLEAGALLAAVPPADHPVLQHLLLQHWAAATRWPEARAPLFRDVSGAGLAHLVKSCAAVVDGFAKDIAEKPPQAAPAPASGGPKPAGGPLSGLRERLRTLAWRLRLRRALARRRPVAWAAQTLAGVAAASRKEDELGLLQSGALLPQAIASLVGCRQAAEAYAPRVAASAAALRQQLTEEGSPAAELKALLMELDVGLYKIASEFGPHVSKIPLAKPVAAELEAFARFEK